MKTILLIKNYCKPNSLLGNIGHGYITSSTFAKTHKVSFIKLEFLTRLKRGPNRNSKAERKQELRHENKRPLRPTPTWLCFAWPPAQFRALTVKTSHVLGFAIGVRSSSFRFQTFLQSGENDRLVLKSWFKSWTGCLVVGFSSESFWSSSYIQDHSYCVKNQATLFKLVGNSGDEKKTSSRRFQLWNWNWRQPNVEIMNRRKCEEVVGQLFVSCRPRFSPFFGRNLRKP